LKKKSSKKLKYCAKCELDVSKYSDEEIYELFNLCRKHKKELKPKENKMECPKCGCQDMKPSSGIAKSGPLAGQQWTGWDCTNPSCVNEKGYQTRIFNKKGVSRPSVPPVAPVSSNIDKKLDLIIKMLNSLQGEMGVEEANKELQLEADSSKEPF
jgi:hypothetical protein